MVCNALNTKTDRIFSKVEKKMYPEKTNKHHNKTQEYHNVFKLEFIYRHGKKKAEASVHAFERVFFLRSRVRTYVRRRSSRVHFSSSVRK